MEENTKKITDLFIQITSLIIMIVPIYFLLKTTPKEVTSQVLITFGIIVGLVSLIFIFSFIYSKYKKMCNDIKINKDDMKEIRKDLNFMELFNNMDKRISVLERLFDKLISKSKRGNFVIDPRIIMWLLLIFLLFLFLRQMGII